MATAGAWTKPGGAARAMGRAERPKIKIVEVDGSVILKIIKHSREFAPNTPVTGQLLGLDRMQDSKSVLEVTSTFPMPQRVDDDEESAARTAAYQTQMLKLMREVNVDCNVVGWYQSSFMGYTHLTEQMVRWQASYQDQLRSCVCLVFDPLRSTPSALSLKAYRLTDKFMEMSKAKKFVMKGGGAPVAPIFEQLPLRVRNSHLVQGLLVELEGRRDATTVDFTGVEQQSGRSYVERSIENMSDCVDEIAKEARSYSLYQRDKSRMAKAKADAMPEPSRLESALQTNQIASYCSQISQFSGEGMAKLYLMQNLTKK